MMPVHTLSLLMMTYDYLPHGKPNYMNLNPIESALTHHLLSDYHLLM